MRRSTSGHNGPGKLGVFLLMLPLCLLFVIPDAGAITREYKITGNRVNVRAQPRLNSEIVSQLEYGASVMGRSFTNDWLEIVPPKDINFWIHRDFVLKNEVTVSKLNVRAGAGINYSVVGELKRGDKVEVLSEFGEWLKIKAPAGASLYLSGDFVKMVQPPEPVKKARPVKRRVVRKVPSRKVPQSVQRRTNVVRTATQATPVRPTVKQSPDLELVPLKGQGQVVLREGVLRPVGFFFGRPSRYRLATFEGNRIETVCYVRGNERQLESFMGQALKIKGQEYWVQGVRYPVVVIQQIILTKDSGTVSPRGAEE